MLAISQVNQAQPMVVDHLIGQPQVTEQLKVALNASWTHHGRLPHALLTGPAGLGKSLVPQIMAAEMGTELISTMGQQLRTPGHVSGFLMQACEDKAVLFIDEVHELRPPCQTQLYAAITERRLVEAGGPFKQSPLQMELPDFTLLAATTDPHRLLKPLRSRFELELRFRRYSQHDLSKLLRQRVRQLGWKVQPEAISLLAKVSLGTPRTGLNLLRSARRIAVAGGGTEIGLAEAERACELAGLDQVGLSDDQQQYLRLLLDQGPCRPRELAFLLDMPLRQLQEVVEPDLVYRGLARNSSEGRTLTRAGRDHARQLAMEELKRELL